MRRDGGAIQQRGEARMEVRSRRSTDHGHAGSEDRQHTSGGVFVSIDRELRSTKKEPSLSLETK